MTILNCLITLPHCGHVGEAPLCPAWEWMCYMLARPAWPCERAPTWWPWLCPHSPCRKARFIDTWGFRSGLCRGFWGNKSCLSNLARLVTEKASSDFMPEIDPGSGISWRELYPSSPLGSRLPAGLAPSHLGKQEFL